MDDGISGIRATGYLCGRSLHGNTLAYFFLLFVVSTISNET